MLDVEVETIAEALPWWPMLRVSALDKQLDGDRAVMQSLEQHGDDGSASRKIDFWFYGDKVKLELLLATLRHEGFAWEAWLDEPSGLIVSRQSPATSDAFDVLTPRLVDLASAHDVEYDGWETIVANEHPREPARGPSFFSKIFGPRNA